MKKLARISAALLAVIMIAGSFVGCHKKNEVAFKIGDTEFTSGMYSCVLFISASNARSQIDTFMSENDIESDDVNYDTYKFNTEGEVAADGTVAYKTYVRNEAVNRLKQYATLDAKFAAEGLELDEASINASDAEAYCQWYYGCSYSTYANYANSGMAAYLSYYYTPYGTYLEENGVAYETFRKYMRYEAMYNFYFLHLYGEDGEKALTADEITSYMTSHYAIADSISFSKKDSDSKELSEEKLKELKAIADAYAERLNAGESFETIYNEETKRQEEESATDSSSSSSSTASSEVSSTESTESTESTSSASGTSSSEDEDEGYTPPTYLGIYGDGETAYEHVMFDEILKQEFGKAVVLEDTENSQYLLVVRRDMTDELYEDYWFDNLRDTVTYALKQEEFDTAINEFGAALSFSEDKHATKPFGVDDIKFEVE